jgi:exodeoxyribonuclease VII small subunit
MPRRSAKAANSDPSPDPREQENAQWRQDVAKLSYEEALQAADLLLSHLQNDAIPLAELERAHRRGQIYLEHCHALLSQLEQSVLELDSDTMAAKGQADATA